MDGSTKWIVAMVAIFILVVCIYILFQRDRAKQAEMFLPWLSSLRSLLKGMSISSDNVTGGIGGNGVSGFQTSQELTVHGLGRIIYTHELFGNEPEETVQVYLSAHEPYREVMLVFRAQDLVEWRRDGESIKLEPVLDEIEAAEEFLLWVKSHLRPAR